MPLLYSQPNNMLLATSLQQVIQPSKSPQMAVHAMESRQEEPDLDIPHLNLSYRHDDSEQSTRNLVYSIRPQWRDNPQQLEFTKFTDGITNTLLRIARRSPGATQEEVDEESILMRAYGNNTDLIIDRDREARSHALLAERGMAPPLYARFDNGLLYKFIPGKVCTPEDLTKEQVWRGVAKKLAEWHARVPISAVCAGSTHHTNGSNGHANGHTNGHSSGYTNGSVNGTNGVIQTNGQSRQSRHTSMHRLPEPNIWSVLQKWVDALPTTTEKEKAKKELLQHEIERTFHELDTQNGIGDHGFVFGHLDLLSGNVIMLPTQPDATNTSSSSIPVTFIDYEYATPAPAVFDIANHFAEWAGFDLDYNRLPIKSTRRAFLVEYLASYNQYATTKINSSYIDSLEKDVDLWRGIPGLYWGIWALIQAKISEIDFDYAQYAEDRLEEYWAWRAETGGNRARDGKRMPLREQRWAEEA